MGRALLIAILAKALLVVAMMSITPATAAAQDCQWVSQWVYDPACDCWYDNGYWDCPPPPPPPPDPVYGCTDPSATNYNPSATADDGSCQYPPPPPPPPVYGCTDPSATNYNPSATADDGSCQYPPPPPPPPVYGCTDPSATNYNPSATVNDGSCQYPPPPPPPQQHDDVSAELAASAAQSAGSGGDLYFDLRCMARARDPYAWFNVTLWIDLYVDEQVVARGTFRGFANVSGSVQARVPASTRDRPVRCEADGDGVHATVTGTLLGSGPSTARFRVNAFIRWEWIWSPVETYAIFAGDDRGFCENCGCQRMSQEGTIVNPAVSNGGPFGGEFTDGPFNGHCITEKYDYPTSVDANGHITQQAKDDWNPYWPLKIGFGFSDTSAMICDATRLGPNLDAGESSTRVHCFASASDPLYWFAPNIDWEYWITMRFGKNRIAYTIDGCHDAYPMHELYINGTPVIQDIDSGSVWDIAANCGLPIHKEGEIR